MLKTPVLHPEILSALGSAGHLAKILITDGNYPHNTRVRPGVKIVWANFMPGVISGTQALKMLADLVPIEEVHVMQPERSGEFAMTTDPPIWADYRKILRDHSNFRGELHELQKPPFNALAKTEDLCLVIATAEVQIFANVLVTIGVVR